MANETGIGVCVYRPISRLQESFTIRHSNRRRQKMLVPLIRVQKDATLTLMSITRLTSNTEHLITSDFYKTFVPGIASGSTVVSLSDAVLFKLTKFI